MSDKKFGSGVIINVELPCILLNLHCYAACIFIFRITMFPLFRSIIIIPKL